MPTADVLTTALGRPTGRARRPSPADRSGSRWLHEPRRQPPWALPLRSRSAQPALCQRIRAVGTGGHRPGLRDGLHRCDRGRHRAAGHRPRLPHRPGHPAVGGHRLHPDPGWSAAHRGCLRRPVRSPASGSDRRGLVRSCLRRVRPRPERTEPHRRPGVAVASCSRSRTRDRTYAGTNKRMCGREQWTRHPATCRSPSTV